MPDGSVIYSGHQVMACKLQISPSYCDGPMTTNDMYDGYGVIVLCLIVIIRFLIKWGRNAWIFRKERIAHKKKEQELGQRRAEALKTIIKSQMKILGKMSVKEADTQKGYWMQLLNEGKTTAEITLIAVNCTQQLFLEPSLYEKYKHLIKRYK